MRVMPNPARARWKMFGQMAIALTYLYVVYSTQASPGILEFAVVAVIATYGGKYLGILCGNIVQPEDVSLTVRKSGDVGSD